MAILDNELFDDAQSSVGSESSLPEQPLGSPAIRPMNLYLGGFENFTTRGDSKTGLTIDQMSQLSKVPSGPSTFASPMQMIPQSELLENKRYDFYLRDRNLENIYGLQQSALSQWGNAAVKFLGNAAGTFAQSFTAVPDAVSAVKKGSFAELSGNNGYKSEIDMFLKNMEDAFPNYMTDYEKEHPYLAMIPFATGSANFWGNMVLKNLGFTAGAIAGAFVQDAIVGTITGGVGEIPLIANQIGKASLYLSKLFAGTNRLEETLNLARTLGKSEKTLLNIKNLAYASESAKIINGARLGLAMYGSAATESAVESRDGYRQIKEELVRQYKLEHFGSEPVGKDAEEIENLAVSGMNSRFGINMGLLLLSNNIQFGNLFRSMIAKDGSIISGKFAENIGEIGLKKGSIDVFESKASTKFLDKAWDRIRPAFGNALVEGVYEEGGQFAAERGVYDYYTRKYKNLSNPQNKENWDTLNEALKSTSYGLSEQFGEQEGVQNMMVGAISALVTGGIIGKANQIRGNDREKRTQSAINILNNSPVTGSFGQKYDNTLNSMGIAREMKDAVVSGDVYKYNNLKDDMFFNFVTSRIPSGMHDVTIEQLKMLKGLDKEEFEKTFGMNFDAENKATVSEYIDGLIEKANSIKKINDSVNFLFKNPFTYYASPTNEQETIERENYKIFEQYKTDITYYHNVKDSSEDRLQKHDAYLKMNINPMLSAEMVSDVLRKDGAEALRDAYESEAAALGATITEFTSPQDKKQIRDRIKALRTMSEKINLAITAKNIDSKGVGEIINFELGGRKSIGDNIISADSFKDIYNIGIDINKDRVRRDRAADAIEALSDKKGFKEYFIQAEQMASQPIPEEKPKEATPAAAELPSAKSITPTFENKEGVNEPIDIDREYEVPSFKKASVEKIAEDRYQVTAPDGTVSFYSNKDNAQEAADILNEEYGDLQKLKVIGVSNDGATIKVEDSKGNIQNISPEKLKGYEGIETEQEQLAKSEEELKKQQAEIEKKSTVEVVEVTPTPPPPSIPPTPTTGDGVTDVVENEGKLKSAQKLFVSGTSEAQKIGVRSSTPRIERLRTFYDKYRTFPNKANISVVLITGKNQGSLGLDGLAQISYDKNLDMKVSDIPGENSVDDFLVMMLFVEIENGKIYFINAEGKRIGELGKPVDIQQLVFDTMPTTSLTYRDGTARYREGQKELAEAKSRSWREKRKEIFESTSAFPITPYKFIVSRGHARTNEGKEGWKRNHVGGLLIDENKLATQQGIIVISEGSVAHQGENITFKAGRIVFQHEDTLTFLNNAKLSNNKAVSLYHVIKNMVDEYRKTRKINNAYATFLQNILVYKSSYSGGNRFWMESGFVYIGKKKFDMTKLDELQDEVVKTLQETFHGINKATLKNNFSEPFTEYIFKDGKLEEVTWRNYQLYLLASKYPDGTARSSEETPITTPVENPTAENPYSFIQKYATLTNMELPDVQVDPQSASISPTPTPPAPTEIPAKRIGTFEFNNGKQNVFTGFNLGPIIFTGEMDDDGKFKNFVIINNPTLQAVLDNESLYNDKILPTLKALKIYKEEASKEENIAAFITQVIIKDLNIIRKKEAPTAPVSVAPTPTAPVSTDAKATFDSAIDQINKSLGNKTGTGIYENSPRIIFEFDGKEPSSPSFLTEPITKEGTLYRVKTSRYNVLIDDTFNIKQVVSDKGKVYTVKEDELSTVDIQSPLFDQPKTTAVSTDAKADIERRRQEELKENQREYDVSKRTNLKGIETFKQKLIDNPNGLEALDGTYQFNIDDRQKSLDKLEKELPININKINAKYDAELAALEQPTETKPIVESSKKEDQKPFNTDDVLPPNNDYRLIAQNEIGEEKKITDADFEAFKKWAAEKVPGIPYQVLDNIIVINDNEKAWGVFEQGVAKFYKGAVRGTEYHEIFEGIWKAFLSPEQREAIIDELRVSGKTFKDRASGKTLEYVTATETQIKERIADDFAEFRLGKLPAKTLGEKIVRFFRNIIEFVKKFVQKPSLKTELFKSIEKGKFKKFVVSESIRRDPSREYSRVPGLSPTQVFYTVQDMTARMGFYLFRDKKSLFDIQKITGKEIFDNIEIAYIQEGRRQQLTDATWTQLVEKTKEKARTLGIRFDEDDRVNVNDEGNNSRDYSPEPFSVDWKKSSPFAVKFLTSSVIDVVPSKSTNYDGTLDLPDAALSKKEEGGVLGLKLIPRGRVFSTLMRNLKETISASRFVQKLANLARNDGSYVRLFQKLGGKLTTSVDGKKAVAGEMSFSEFGMEDWRLFVNMMDVFAKQQPNAYIQYSNIRGETYTSSADVSGAQRILEEGWFENMKVLSEDGNSIITKNQTDKVYKVDRSKLPSKVPKSPAEMIAFLENIGITFPESVYDSLKDVNKFAEEVVSIFNYLESKEDIYTLSGKTLGIENRIKELSKMYVEATSPPEEASFIGIGGAMYQKYTNHNYASKFVIDFGDSKTIDELKDNRPELNDVFATNSVKLKKGGLFVDDDGKIIKKLEVSYIQGNSEDAGKVEIETSQLPPGARLTQELNQNLSGRYSILVNADSSTQWLVNLLNEISYNEVASGKAFNRVFDIFRGYLSDEIALAKSNRKHLLYMGNKAKQLRFFKDILPTDIVDTIHAMISRNDTDADINKYIDENIEDINDSIRSFIEDTVKDTKDYLIDTGEISQDSEGQYSYSSLDTDFINRIKENRESLSEEVLNNILTFANINYVINNIELHKIMFGDPYQFKIDRDGNLDELKRIKSFLSPRRLTIDFPEFNSALNDVYNKTGDGIELSPEDLGYHLFKDHAKTITFKDVKYSTSRYDEVNEADAQSWIMDNVYREVKIKHGQWPTEAEQWHQWQMAYTRRALAKLGEYKYTSDKLKKHDEKLLEKPEPKYVTDVLKPIVSGLKQGVTDIEMVLDKFSQAPLYYKFYEERNLGKLYIKMWKEKIDYGVMESGRKEGATELNTVYNAEGGFNTSPFVGIVNVPWKSYGIQVENSYDKPKDQTRGSQMTKLSSLDLFEYGNGSTDAERLYKKQTEILDKLHENGYNQLIDNLGIEDLGAGNYELKDKEALSQSLTEELLRREASENTKDTIQVDKETGDFPIPFEASNSYKKIKDIVYSMVTKAITSPKVNGGPKVMISSTMFEKADEKRDGKSPNPTLKFYTKDEPYMEIYLPHWFKNKFNKKRFPTDESILDHLNKTEEGKSILMGVGFRIPTQGSASIEVFRVAGFLSQAQGDSVVVPSEMVSKTNADFDVDKLNTYLKSVYLDEKGNIKLVKLKGTEQETKEFYGKVFDSKTERAIIRVNDLYALLQNRILEASGFTSTEEEQESIDKLEEKVGDLLDAILEDVDDVSNYEATLTKELNKLGDKDLQSGLRKKYVDNMYKKALENAYYETLIEMISLPENFERLLSPVDDAGLKDMAKEMDTLTKEDTDAKGKLLSRTFMSFVRHAFVSAKKWIGIAAVNITAHSLAQKAGVYVKNVEDWEDVSDFDREFLGDGVVNLPHNTVEINDKTLISLAGRKTKDGLQFISDRLSGYATALVDVAKDPYIIKIIPTKKLLGVAMFLERIGVGKTTIHFLNQPIIREYVKLLNSKKKSSRLFSRAEIETIVEQFGGKASETFNVDELVKNIDAYYSDNGLSQEKNAEQVRIFYEFLKYAKMADFSFKFTQAINYDTTKFRNSDSLFKKQLRTSEASRKNIISSVEKVMDSTFLGKQAFFLDKSMAAIGSSIFKLDGGQLGMIARDVLKPFAEKDFMYEDDYEEIAEKIKQSFLDYIIQTQSSINKEIYALFVDAEKSVASALLQAKKDYPNMRILKDLQVVSSARMNKPTMSIRLAVDTRDPIDEDIYTELMRELRDNPETNALYYDIVMLAILQGTASSNISIKNIIPVEDYSEIIKPIIDRLSATADIQAFSKNGSFQRNNWKDDRIVPVFQPKYTTVNDQDGEPILVSVDPYTDEEIYKYRFRGFNVEGLSDNDTKKIFLVNEKYLSSENRSAIESDFIKIPYIVTVDKKTGERVNTRTNTNMTSSRWTSMIKGNHPDLNGYYGYKKVKYENGDPIITKKGEYVYKLVNLYGDGKLVAEHYTTPQKSALNNGTFPVDNEMNDSDIIKAMDKSLASVEESNVKKKVEFNKLPFKSATPTMTYAGIGSRETPTEVLEQMTEVAKTLASRGYTLNTGVTFGGKEEGADAAFSRGAAKKNLFSPEKQGNRTKEQVIAKEVHPNPKALSPAALKLMARNTNQVFGDNLDTPVDFVLFYAKETGGIRPQGGTGQAVEMARRKGIPTINMANANWREQLYNISPVSKTSAKISTPSGKLKLKDGKEYNISEINASLLESIGYKPKEIGKILKSIC